MWRSLSIAGLGVTLLSLNAAAQPAPPPMNQYAPDNRQSADGYGPADMSCRRSAAARTGYRASGQAMGEGSQAEQRYAAAYYACMNDQDGAPRDAYADGAPPPNDYAYGAPTGDYAYGAPGAYYPYAPYPSPYPYYPSYYGPGYYGPDVTLGFGFGGGHGGGRHR